MIEVAIVVGIFVLIAGLVALVVRYAKKSTRESSRADMASETADVEIAIAEPVAPAGTVAQLKDRAKRRREHRAALRNKRGW